MLSLKAIKLKQFKWGDTWNSIKIDHIGGLVSFFSFLLKVFFGGSITYLECHFDAAVSVITTSEEAYQILYRAGQIWQNCKDSSIVWCLVLHHFSYTVSMPNFKLEYDRVIQASGLSGPIPAGIASLTKLTDLWVQIMMTYITSLRLESEKKLRCFTFVVVILIVQENQRFERKWFIFSTSS